MYDTRLGARVSEVTSKCSSTEVSFYTERLGSLTFIFYSGCLWHFLVMCETQHLEIAPVDTALKLCVPEPGRKAQAGEMEIAIAIPVSKKEVTSAREVGKGKVQPWREAILQGEFNFLRPM